MKTQEPSAHASPADLVYTLRAGNYRDGELHVLSFEGTEEMSGLYAFDVVAWCKDIEDGALEAGVIGLPAVLTMHLADGASRAVRGIVSTLVFEGRREGGRHVLRLTIVPRAFLLHKRVNSRIFQDKTVQQVADVLLEEHGISRAFHLLSKYPSRQYCVQYQESDYQFLTRIIAEEGIFFYFEHPDDDAGDDPERLIFADSAHAYPAISGDRTLVYRPQQGEGAMHAEENQVQDLRVRARVESNAVMMRDYDFRRPLLDLESGTGVEEKPTLEVYDHHGEYEETDADTGNAAVLLEQLRRGVREAHGRSVCRRLVPGHVLTLADHDAERLNTAHVVTSVEHRGVTPEAAQGSTRLYDNRFRCVLAEVPFRPARPARQLRHVTESAVVVGPEGQEIFTDAFGRIKVQFHWDREGQRNAQSSCWMRVAQAWAGSGWGFQFIPRIGMEVLVSFLGGDQDRPVVVGCLYNAQNPPPHPLPGNATRSGIRTNSTPGGAGANEIAFEDRAGNEQLFVRAQRNLDEDVGLDRTEKVARDATETIGADLRTRVGQHRHDETEGDHRVTIQGGRSVTVAGRDSVQVGGPRTTAIGGLDSTHVDGARVLEVDGPRTVRLGGNDTLFIKGSRSEVIEGEDAKAVLGPARVTFSKTCAVNAAAGIQLSVGTKSAPASAEAQLSGDLILRGKGGIEISSESRIRLRVGKTILTLGPKEARLEAETISLSAKAIEALGEEGSLSVGKEVTLKGSAVKLASKDAAILELDQEARLDGKAVKIKPGLAAEMAKAEQREEQAKELPKTTVHLFDLGGQPISNAPYEVSFFGFLDAGVAKGGTVEIPAFPDVEKAHVRWGRPMAERDDPPDSSPYEYEMDVYLTTGECSPEESLRRKLHNMGHKADDLHAAIRHYQDSIGAPRTGSAGDVKDEIDGRHQATSPASLGGRQDSHER